MSGTKAGLNRTGDGCEGLVHGRQAPYQLNYTPDFSVFNIKNGLVHKISNFDTVFEIKYSNFTYTLHAQAHPTSLLPFGIIASLHLCAYICV